MLIKLRGFEEDGYLEFNEDLTIIQVLFKIAKKLKIKGSFNCHLIGLEKDNGVYKGMWIKLQYRTHNDIKIGEFQGIIVERYCPFKIEDFNLGDF